MAYVICPLGPEVDRTAFACGETALDDYLQRHASQDIKRGVARVFVASPADQPQQIAGYYTLSAASVAAQTLPEAWRTRLPADEPWRSRHIADFIAGMTDYYAMERYREIYGKTPKGLSNV